MRPKAGLTEVAKAALALKATARIKSARTALILDEPFFGVLAMKLVLVTDWECETMWTDGVSMGGNPIWVDEQSDAALKGTVVHEVLHCANGHPWRRENRDPEDWNEACDEAINPIIDKAGYLLPDNVLRTPAYAGKSAEWIYEQIFRKKQKEKEAAGQQQQSGKQGQQSQGGQPQPGNNGQGQPQQQGAAPQNGQPQPGTPGQGQPQPGAPGNQPPSGQPQPGNPGQGQPQPGSQPGQGGAGQPGKKRAAGEVRDAPKGVDPKQLAQEWTISVEQAQRQAASMGRLPGFVEQLVENNRKPQVDWREALWDFVQKSFYNPDYRYTRPHQNYMHLGLYMPSLVGEQMPPMVAAKDTSASVYTKMTEAFNAELEAILDQMKPEVLYELMCDTRVTHVREIYPGDSMTPASKGRGGTDFRPAFKWVDDEGVDPVCFTYMSDMDGTFPEKEPDYPVLWVCPPDCKDPPWGTKIEMPFMYD